MKGGLVEVCFWFVCVREMDDRTREGLHVILLTAVMQCESVLRILHTYYVASYRYLRLENVKSVLRV